MGDHGFELSVEGQADVWVIDERGRPKFVYPKVATTWDGRFRGVAGEKLESLQATREFELKFDTGSVGRAVLPNGRDLAYLDGLSKTPF